jgi:uncharacterized protein (TIGR00725 family)
MAKDTVGIIGASKCTPQEYERAYKLGKGLAQAGRPVVCGGLSGIMEAVSKGVAEEGGLAVGILPQSHPSHANPYITIAVATGLGHARNFVIVNTSKVLIAVGGEYGTLSEIALALKTGKTVLGLDTWQIPGVVKMASVEEALKTVREILL